MLNLIAKFSLLFMEFHKEVFSAMKTGGFLPQVQDDLRVILDDYKKNPQKSIARYEKIISRGYLNSCQEASDIYFFMMFKLSLSELSEERNVLSYQELKLHEVYENQRLPTLLKEEFPIGTLLANTDASRDKRNGFLAGVLEYNGHLYELLEENMRNYDALERISKTDEDLEGELRNTLMQCFVRDFTKNLLNAKSRDNLNINKFLLEH